MVDAAMLGVGETADAADGMASAPIEVLDGC